MGRSDERTPIDELYAPESLMGWTWARHAYAELELRWDGRRPVSPGSRGRVDGGGWFAGIYGGRVTRLDGGADFLALRRRGPALPAGGPGPARDRGPRRTPTP